MEVPPSIFWLQVSESNEIRNQHIPQDACSEFFFRCPPRSVSKYQQLFMQMSNPSMEKIVSDDAPAAIWHSDKSSKERNIQLVTLLHIDVYKYLGQTPVFRALWFACKCAIVQIFWGNQSWWRCRETVSEREVAIPCAYDIFGMIALSMIGPVCWSVFFDRIFK